MVGTYLKMLSLRPIDEVQSTIDAHLAAPERRVAQRSLATELTTLVHGEGAARAAERAADVLFGGDPMQAGDDALAVVAAEVPSIELPERVDGLRVHELLVAAGVAASNSEVNRLLGQGAVRAGNRVLGADGLLNASDLVNGWFLLLRKGKRDFVAGKVSRAG